MDTENRNGSLGPIVGIVIILLIIIVGGLYFWSHRQTGTPAPADQAAASGANTDVQAITTQSSSDDASAIQADLNATNVDSVDSGLTQ